MAMLLFLLVCCFVDIPFTSHHNVLFYKKKSCIIFVIIIIFTLYIPLRHRGNGKSVLRKGGRRKEHSSGFHRRSIAAQLSWRMTEGSHERHQQSWRSSLSQKRMVKQFESGGSLSWIAYKHPIQKALQTGGNLETKTKTCHPCAQVACQPIMFLFKIYIL